MSAARLVRRGDGAVLADRVEVARTFRRRFVGWMGRRLPAEGHALVLPGCRAVHTCFVRGPVDLLFAGEGWDVTDVREGLAPWSLANTLRGAHAVEFPAGTVRRHRVAVGDGLVLEEGA